MWMPLLATVLATSTPAATSHAAPASAHEVAKNAWHPVVPFIEDDYTRAVALAKERHLPVFIEGWAPW